MTTPMDDPFNDPDLADLLGPATTKAPVTKAPEPAPVAAPTPVQPPVQAAVPVSAPAPVASRPAPEAELSAEQKEIRDLRHQLAVANSRKLENLPDDAVELIPAVSADRIIIHFVRDGFTHAGRIWYRGQELAFDPGTQPYEDTKDRYGFSWLDLDEMGQAASYGHVFWRKGPWPGKRFDDPTAEAKERQRAMAAPAMPRI